MKTKHKPDFYIDGKYIVLNFVCEYDIPLKEVDGHQGMLQWCEHLSGKTWMDYDRLCRFVEMACEANGVHVPDDLARENMHRDNPHLCRFFA